MKKITLSTKEKEIALHSGSKCGEYLDSIGKTNLADLDTSEWEQFCFIFAHEFTLGCYVDMGEV